LENTYVLFTNGNEATSGKEQGRIAQVRRKTHLSKKPKQTMAGFHRAQGRVDGAAGNL